LALVSGLLGTALNLDDPDRPIVPATGQSNFSFSLQPHASIDVKWKHDHGQVEIDALFTARRQGRETLFLVEAKTSGAFGTLAKHKLVYPLLALHNHVPNYLKIVPVYLRVIKIANSLHFLVSECALDFSVRPAVSSLVSLGQTKRLVLQGYG